MTEQPAPTYAMARMSSGNILHVSGQVPRDRRGRTVGEGDFDAQCRQVFRNLADVLAGAGLGMAAVDRLLVFVTRPELIPRASALRAEVFEAPFPACTSVAVTALADPAWMIEIEATASVR